jgi:EmrB/QacA subfamily drug resistance transporter
MKAPALSAERLVPLIVATALFMENLDATVLGTSLPAIAADLGENPIHLKLAVTTYLLALAIFIPASGWVADRFGARRVFSAAMVVFAAGSISCGFAHDIWSLVAGRVVQGIGGAMMIPVGRLIVLRTVDRRNLVDALAWLTIPALLGPVMGPPVGGFITTYFDWRWIFWINVPIALVGILLSTRFIPHVAGTERVRFDAFGFLLVGPGLATALTGATLAGLSLISAREVIALVSVGVVLLGAYVVHALRTPYPLIDLRLLELPSFRASVAGGFVFRVGMGATPFLLPLMLQVGFGMDPFHSGLTTFASGIGAITMKLAAGRILRRFGFRPVILANAVLCSAFVAAPGLFSPATPAGLMLAILLIGGFLRSLQFTSINTVIYSDVPEEKLSRATTFSTVLQELTGSVGVSVAALGLEATGWWRGVDALDAGNFTPVFLFIGALAMSSVVIFWRMLPLDAGSEMVGRHGRKEPAGSAAE